MPKVKKIKPVLKDILKDVLVDVKCVGRTYHASGPTLDEALDKIKIGNGARALSVVTVTRGESVREKILNSSHTNNLFGNTGPTARLIALKWVKQLF